MDLTPIKNIDKVLKAFYETKSSLGLNHEGIMNKTGLLDDEEVILITEKLEKEKLISVFNEKLLIYIITFDGVIFHLNDGYQGQYDSKNAENIRLGNLESHQTRHQSYMTWLTVVLAVGILPSFCLALADLYWKYQLFQSVLHPSFVNYILIGTITFLIIAFSVYLYPKIKSKNLNKI